MKKNYQHGDATATIICEKRLDLREQQTPWKIYVTHRGRTRRLEAPTFREAEALLMGEFERYDERERFIADFCASHGIALK